MLGEGERVLISPAEHNPLLKSLGTVSSQVEPLGADFLFLTKQGLVGVQRKACPDFVQSIRGDRIAREIDQMQKLHQGVFLIEGEWAWDREGYCRWGYSRKEYNGAILSIQSFGIWIIQTDNISETADCLQQMESWFSRGEHHSLLRRPKAKVDSRLHLLQYFDGVSLTRAKAIYKFFGRVPLRWDCTREEMMQVPGIGKGTVNKLWRELE